MIKSKSMKVEISDYEEFKYEQIDGEDEKDLGLDEGLDHRVL